MNPEEIILLNKIKSYFFTSSKVVINENIEGQQIINNKINLGLKAGPSILTSNLTHEMCHLVEIDDARTTAPNWGFKYGNEQYLMGNIYYTYDTIQCIEREIRVWAYQQNIHNYFGIESSPKEFSQLSPYLGDFSMLAYGEKFNLKSQAKAVEWVESKIIETMKVNTFEKFCQEWNRKFSLIETITLK